MESITNFINDLFLYEFLQDAFLVSIVLGIGCGVVGCFIILKGLSLMGDAISHAVIPGVALSYLLKISYFIGAIVFGILAAIGMGIINRNSKIKSDTSIGIVFSAFLALGILIISKIQSSIDLNNILFGNILIVTPTERIMAYVVVGIILLLVLLFYKEILWTLFDETMAKASGLPVRLINYLILLMLTVITVVSLQTVGAILVVALLITPAATAFLLTNNFTKMIFLSALIGLLSSVVGLYLSITYNLPSGVVIVLSAFAFFLLAFLFSPRNGLFIQRLKAF